MKATLTTFVAFMCLQFCNAQLLWQKEFTDHSFGSRAIFHDVFFSSSGEVLMAGTTEETKSDRAFCLMKFSDSLQKSWVLADTTDLLFMPENDIVLSYDEMSQNAYIAGTHIVTSNLYRGALLKIDSLGKLIWNITLPIPDSLFPRTRDIKVDNDGNILIALTVSSFNFFDTWIMKYTPTGSLEWLQKYTNLPEHDAQYVPVELILSPDSDDFYCVLKGYHRILTFRAKLNDGAIKWVAGPWGTTDKEIFLANGVLDQAGNTIIGYSGSPVFPENYDIYVTKVNPIGEVLWNKLIPLNTSGNDVIERIAEKSGNIYGVGHTATTNQGRNSVFFKLDVNGELQWEKIEDEFGYDDIQKDILIDKHGNIYISGFAEVSTQTYASFLYSYDSSASLRWKEFEFPTAKQETEYFKMGFSSDTSSLLTGGLVYRYERPEMSFFSFHIDFKVRKTDTAWGNLVAEGTHAGQGKAFFSGRWVKADDDGNVYFAGYRNLGFTIITDPRYRNLYDLVVLKYNAAGNLLWSRIFEENVHTEIRPPIAAELDRNGEPVFLLHENPEFGTQSTIVKFQHDGTLAWKTELGTNVFDNYSQPNNLNISDNNNYFVLYRDTLTLAVAKLNSDGNVLWKSVVESNFVSCGDYWDSKLLLSSGEETLVAYGSSGCLSDFFVKKLDATGRIRWSKQFSPIRDCILLSQNELLLLTDSKVYKINFQTGEQIWEVNIPRNSTISYPRSIHYRNDVIIVISQQEIFHFATSGQVIFQKKLDLPVVNYSVEENHIFVSDWIFGGIILNFYGEIDGSFKCPECEYFFPVYPQTVANAWGWGPGTIGLDVKDGIVYFGGIKNYSLHGGPLYLAAGSDVLQLSKYAYQYLLTSEKKVNKTDSHKVSIYPNPNDGNFTLLLASFPSEIFQIEIFEASGRLVRSYSNNLNFEQTHAVQINDLKKPGIYFVKVFSNQTSEWIKIIVH